MEERSHVCHSFPLVDHNMSLPLSDIVQPLMTDGITLGRPRCAIDTCREDLGNNRDIFCPTHFQNHFKCAVRSCPQPAVVGKMCADPQHQKMESLRKARNDAPFQLSKCMQRMRVTHPNDSMLSDSTISDNRDTTDDLEGNLEWFELEGETAEDVRMFNEANPGGIGEEDVPEADEALGMSPIVIVKFQPNPSAFFLSVQASDSTIGTARPRCKTDLSRSRTHNEQTLVRACGTMLGHAPFYNAEAVSNVLVRVSSLSQTTNLQP